LQKLNTKDWLDIGGGVVNWKQVSMGILLWELWDFYCGNA